MTKFFRIGLASLAVVVAGCGSSQASGSPQLALISSVSNTTAANTAHMSLTVTGPANITAQGGFNFATKQGQLTETLTLPGSATPTSLDSVVDGPTVYEKLPPSLAQYTGTTTPWIKIDTAALAKNAGFDTSGIASTQTSDPTSSLTMLTAAGPDVTVVGKEQVRGVETTHYKANLDLAAAAAKEKDATRKATLTKLAQIYNNKPVPVDVWVDADKRVRKLTYSLNTADINLPTSSTTAPAATVNLDLEFYDFGTAVNVTVPAADQVTDLATLTGGAQPGTGSTAKS